MQQLNHVLVLLLSSIYAIEAGFADRSSDATNFSCAASPSSPASLAVFANGNYTVAIAGAAVFAGGKVSLHAAGRFFDSEEGSLALVGAGVASSGSDPRLGAFSAFALTYATTAAPPLRVAATFTCFSASGAVVFAAAFPDGAPGTNTSTAALPTSPLGNGEFGSSSAPVAHFPSFAASPGVALGSSLAFVEINGRLAQTIPPSATACADSRAGRSEVL